LNLIKAQKAHTETPDMNENSIDDDEDRLVISEADDMEDMSLDQNMDKAQDLSKWSGRKRVAPKNKDFIDTGVVITKTKKRFNRQGIPVHIFWLRSNVYRTLWHTIIFG
jgi:hypothetical protein